MKRKHLIVILLAGLFSLSGFSQSEEPNFSISVSSDSVYFGNRFKVTFTLENGQGENFMPPDFASFQMASGQMMSSSMSIVNGEMSQTSAYFFYLEPKEIGRYFIEPASIMVDGEVLETMPYEVFILANPEGIRQEIEGENDRNSFFREFDMTFPPAPNFNSPERREMEKNKSKRKTTRL